MKVDIKKDNSRTLKQFPSPVYELKLLKYLMDNNMPVEVLLIDGTKFSGLIKWFSNWMLSLEIEGRKNEVMFNKRTISYYKQSGDSGLSEEEINNMPEPDISGVETAILQRFKDNKTHLLFCMRNNIKLEGTVEWVEKLIYHIRSFDGGKDNNLYKGSILYFEELSS